MSQVEARMVRVYLSESIHELEHLLKCLHDELKVCGGTVVRGIEGYGSSGVIHDALLVDLPVDLPLVLEFFDAPENAMKAIERISDFVDPGHVVSWPVTVEGGGAC
jgi:PII-like signaling protein